ncbi:glycosyltransferase family 2 protein [Actinoplanes subtropicus]|uniref:glycosyltransferase family 2 protein n=1 Tax=Actinoplanes subtropicus TaxID=543632 RepID=UPI0004C4503E|nr:glycosyltransferase family 2 protein [Actinoplanes subtropicus]
MLTVILPHFRCARYLPAAVRSVLGQTVRNLRLVVVDDCSPDDDWVSALAPFRDDPRLTVLRASRRVGHLRLKNAVLPTVTTPYVGFQDADDESEPNRFAVQVAMLERGRADLVGSGFTQIDAEGRVTGMRRMPRNGNLWIRMGRTTVALHPTTVVRRAVFSRLGGFDGTAEFGADTDFHLRLARLYRIRNSRLPLYRYRVWAQSLTGAPETGFGSPARQAYVARLLEAEQRRKQARGPAELLPLLVAPGNDVDFDLEPVR